MNNTSTSKAKRFKIVNYEDATPEVQAIYDDTKRTLQIPFVLNWIKCQGSNATLLSGNWNKLKSTLMMGNVPNVLKQLIIYNVSKERNCEYCAQAHGIFADSMSAMISDNPNFRVTENLDSPIIPESYRTAISVVSKAALNSSQITEEDFDLLEKAGFDEEEIQELMAQADLVNMLNTLADISGIKLDNELMEAQA
ncbi:MULTISPECIES: carboxymuconolactone decarboxylase family protein [Leeuwenhoekiella]|mgnify:FL=1|jgi:AhpD family alkylhydroperoxidase|uniref:Alkylhydroperoxidase AhpD core n=1 Tax=Leeuwenhoekiella blandensis (strain CECT 7118 / CCUG 51940 / KCTC 22103 / MED217) TaxID=398720 RepID=A3XKM6_LEEBM|nr:MULTISPECIES: carboxymuconolactone decarboxylase family protein [Leeuwenhoekiella]EAQ49902.1 Alkylhydroperoxidase AhpD core [Leeuwenhoekiella blandensis MED217]MAO42571.1 carboxymuconolactone decarboxylase family protein [Leeuwenhoekiella sp.]MBQ51927.1 carboxymuconolactone decarboxylase family protein [Leeuwenhoekiella sp.]HBT10513.1 carboxymuconolactone decarboxylase family protein [Leeuwenhoekiella sp.]|tara:strand:- start:11784 stop:12371 length:588 start_codon:yes stop_codon:yes gene_type:complete